MLSLSKHEGRTADPPPKDPLPLQGRKPVATT